ncbi:MAG: hypothetical protein WCY81_00410 [Sphaerochaetaceae bacterium]
MAHMKKAISFWLVLVIVVGSLWAASPSYLHVDQNGPQNYFQFNDKGILVEHKDPPVQLQRGWILLSNEDPIVLRSSDVTVVLDSESMLSIGETAFNNFSFYLVAGSASFLADTPFSGLFAVSTPVGHYSFRGPGEIYVTSDTSELVFSLGGQVQVRNALTRKTSLVPQFAYLDLADPFMTAKPISLQTFERMSLQPDKAAARVLKADTTVQQLTTAKVEEIVKAEVEVAKTPVEKKPIITIDEKFLGTSVQEPKGEVIGETQGLTISAFIPEPTEKEVSAPVEVEASLPPVEYDSLFIAHTNDILGELHSGIGFARLATLVQWGRSATDATLLLDAGNSASGTPVVETLGGEPIGVLFDLLGYDAVALGEADYAYGIDQLRMAKEIADDYSDVNILAANVLDLQGNALFDQYHIYDVDGYNVGVIGVSNPPQSVTDVISFSSEMVDYAQELVNFVNNQSDIVVVLGQAPVDADLIAQELDNIDLIITLADQQTHTVNNTLIVANKPRLESVGIVEALFENKSLIGLYPYEVPSSVVDNPSNFDLAREFGINYVEEDADVAAYIRQQESQYVALTTSAPEPVKEIVQETVVEPKVTPIEPPQVTLTVIEEEKVDAEAKDIVVASEEEIDERLTVKGSQGLTTREDVPVATPPMDWGVSTTLSVVQQGLETPLHTLVGVSVKPFFNHKQFSLGLQAYFLTEYSLFNYHNYDVNNFTYDSDEMLDIVADSFRFVDYVRYGTPGSSFYLNIDRSSDMNFGLRSVINRFNPPKEHLSVYSSMKMGSVGVELFLDDLELQAYRDGEAQVGAARVSIDFGRAFTLGVGSLFSFDDDFTGIAYPSLDVAWKISDTRKMGFTLFGELATKLNMSDFSVKDFLDTDSDNVSDMFPNFLATIGLDVRTLSWNFRFAGNVEQRDDESLLSFNAFNNTHYSAQPLLDNSEMVFTAYGEAEYVGSSFSFRTSYVLPLTSSFAAIVPLQTDAAVEGDLFSIEVGHTGKHLEAKAGLRRFGFISAVKDLASVSGGVTEWYDGIKTFLTGDGKAVAQPFVSLSYRHGLFALGGELAMTSVDSTYAPQLSLYSTVTVGKQAISEATDPTYSSAVFTQKKDTSKGINFEGSLSSAYMRNIAIGGTDTSYYYYVNPVIRVYKDSAFSIGIGPSLVFDLDNITLPEDQFDFGSSYSGAQATYDTITDALGLIDHITIGNHDSAFKLNVQSGQHISMGPVVQNLVDSSEAPLYKALGLTSSLKSTHVDADFFVNDVKNPQLAGLRFAFRALKNYQAEFGISAVTSAVLSDEPSFDMIPTVDVRLPLFATSNNSVALNASVSTLVGFEDNKAELYLLTGENGNFFERLDNYLIAAGVDMEFGSFGSNFTLAAQKGALSYGMFNPMFSRERSDHLLDTLSDGHTGGILGDMRLSAAASLSYTGKKVDIATTYNIGMTDEYKFNLSDDFFSIAATTDLKWFDFAVTFAKHGFASGITNFIDSNTSVVDNLSSFFFGEHALIGGSLSITQGPITLTAGLSNAKFFSPDSPSWNSEKPSPGQDSTHLVSIGATIKVF